MYNNLYSRTRNSYAVGIHKNGIISRDPFSRFTYGADFVAGTAFGAPQPYGNNNNDGRLFRDPSNVTATYCPDNTGLLIAQPGSAGGMRRTNKGVFCYMSGTNGLLWNRDLNGGIAGATWVATNMTAAKTQVGADGGTNKATLLTATAANATIAQTVAGNVQRVFSLDIKRVTGTGPVLLSLDGGATTTDISSLITSTYSQQFITQNMPAGSTVQVGLGTSGDQVAVDFLQLCTPTVSGLNIPTLQRYETTTATLINSQTRPNAAQADAGPLPAVIQGNFGFYAQFRTQRPTGGFPITGSVGVFVTSQPDGTMTFSAGSGTSTVATGNWRVGLNQVNKVCGYFDSSGNVKVALNGVVGSLATNGTTSPTCDHFDLGTNGAGANTIMGIYEKFYMGPSISFTDTELQNMTT